MFIDACSICHIHDTSITRQHGMCIYGSMNTRGRYYTVRETSHVPYKLCCPPRASRKKTHRAALDTVVGDTYQTGELLLFL